MNSYDLANDEVFSLLPKISNTVNSKNWNLKRRINKQIANRIRLKIKETRHLIAIRRKYFDGEFIK